jgi:hypothetical protein
MTKRDDTALEMGMGYEIVFAGDEGGRPAPALPSLYVAGLMDIGPAVRATAPARRFTVRDLRKEAAAELATAAAAPAPAVAPRPVPRGWDFV